MDDKMSKSSMLLKRWQEGDRDALASLLDRHMPWLKNKLHNDLWAKPVLKKMGETEDYIQDAVVMFLQYTPPFVVSDEEKFRGLLWRIATNAMANTYKWLTATKRKVLLEARRLSSDTTLYLDPPGAKVLTPSTLADRHEREAWVRLGLMLMDPAGQEVLILHNWEKTPFTEIAERLGITQEAARMRYNRAAPRLAALVLNLRRGRLDEILKESPLQQEEGA